MYIAPKVVNESEQIFPTLDVLYLLDCLRYNGLDRTYHAGQFIFSFAF